MMLPSLWTRMVIFCAAVPANRAARTTAEYELRGRSGASCAQNADAGTNTSAGAPILQGHDIFHRGISNAQLDAPQQLQLQRGEYALQQLDHRAAARGDGQEPRAV